MRRLTTILLPLSITLAAIAACAGGQTVKDVPKTKDVEAQLVLEAGKPARVEKFKATWNVKGFGPVKYTCKATPCTASELEGVSVDDAKRQAKTEEWKEYREVELPNQNDVPTEKRKRQSVLSLTGKYVDGQREGEWKTLNEDGSVLRTAIYVKGKKNGPERKYNKTNAVVEEKNYVDDQLEGAFFRKTPKDLLMQIEGTYKAGKMNGQWKVYYVTPKPAEKPEEKPGEKVPETDVAPKPEPENPTETLSASLIKYETACVNDVKSGTYKAYNREGKVSSEGSYSNGARKGLWKIYFPTGTVQSEGNYEVVPGKDPEKCSFEVTGETPPNPPGHKRVGAWKTYYPNGKVFSEGESNGAKAVGTWSFYSNTGIKRFEGTMKNALMMDQGKVWDPAGKMLGDGKFFFTILTMDDKTKDLKDAFKPSVPFIYYKDGNKWFEVKKANQKGEVEAVEYSPGGGVLGSGPVALTIPPKKQGCWTMNGKKIYFMMDKPNETMGKQQNCK